MHTLFLCFTAFAVCGLVAGKSFAQSAKDIRGPSPLLAIENEPAPKLIVDPPLPEPLSLGRVFIQYRTENRRVVPVFGKGALTFRLASDIFTLPSTIRRGTSSTPAVKQLFLWGCRRGRTKFSLNWQIQPTK